MKKVMMFLFAAVFMISFASAAFETITYDSNVQPYGQIQINDWLFFDLADYNLTAYDCSVLNCWAEGDYQLYSTTTLFDGMYANDINGNVVPLPGYKFFIEDVAEVSTVIDNSTQNCTDWPPSENGTIVTTCQTIPSNYTVTNNVNYWKEYNAGDDLSSGTGRWRIELTRFANKQIDFILHKDGLDFTQWAWFNTSWQYKRAVTLNSTVSSTLTDFPSLVVLDTASLIAAGKMNSSCKDVRFLDSSETVELKYEIENNTCNQSSTPIWVKVPSLASGNQTIYVYYGNPLAQDAQNASGVWQNYSFVNHFTGVNATSSKSGLKLVDGANVSYVSGYSGAYPGSSISSIPSATTGEQIATVTNTSLLSDSNTNNLNVFVKLKQNGTGYNGITYPVFYGSGPGNFIGIFRCGVDSASSCVAGNDDYWTVYFKNGGTASFSKYTPIISKTNWVFLSVSVDLVNDKFYNYVNGTVTDSASLNDGSTNINDLVWTGAPTQGNSGYQPVLIDELRIGLFNASADWSKAETAQLYSVGTEESAAATTVVLNSPNNSQTYTLPTQVNFTFTMDGAGNFIKNSTIFFYKNGVPTYFAANNYTFYPSTINASTIVGSYLANITVEANYTWGVTACSVTDLCGTSANRTFFLDSTPHPIYISPTPANGSTINTTYIPISVQGVIPPSTNDTYVANGTIYLWNTSSSIINAVQTPTLNPGNWNFIGNGAFKTGVKINVTVPLTINSITKYSPVTATKCYIIDSTNTNTLASGTFSGNDCSVNYAASAGLYYVAFDANGIGWDIYRQTGFSFPANGTTTVQIIGGYYNGAPDVYYHELTNITTTQTQTTGGLVSSYFASGNPISNNFTVVNGNYTYSAVMTSQGGRTNSTGNQSVQKLGPEITVSLVAPANASTSNYRLNTFTFSGSSQLNLSNYSILTNEVGGFNRRLTYTQANFSGNISGTFTNLTANYSTSNTSIIWGIEVCDIAGLCARSSNRTLFLNFIPVMVFISPTPANNSVDGNATFNIRYNETNNMFSNATLNIYNSTSLYASLFSNNSSQSYSLIVPNGVYRFNVTAYGSTGEVGYSENRTVTRNAPIITLNSPANGSTGSNPLTYFNASIYGKDLIDNYTLYNNNSGSWIAVNNSSTSIYYLVDLTSYIVNSGSYSTAYFVKNWTGINSLISNVSLHYNAMVNPGPVICYPVSIRYFYTNGSSATTNSCVYYSQLGTNVTLVNPNNQTTVGNIEFWLNGQGYSTVTPSYIQGIKPVNTTVNLSTTYNNDMLWGYQACQVNGLCFNSNNFTLFKDSVAPVITLTSPTNRTQLTQGDQLFVNWSITEPNLASCWYNYNGTNRTVTCGSAATNFSYVYKGNNLTFYANDTFGNLGSSVINWRADVYFINQTYNNQTVETSLEPFTTTIDYDSATWSSAVMYLVYNNTAYASPSTGVGDVINFAKTIAITAVPVATNQSFYWSLQLTNGTGTFIYNSTTKQQLVYPVNFALCNYSQGPQLYFRTVSTTNTSKPVNATFSSFWTITTAGGDQTLLNRSYQDLSETKNTFGFCITPSTSNYTLSVAITVDANGYTQTNHYIVDTTYSVPGRNITLYLLADNSSTLTELSVVNWDYNAVADAYITVQRYDLATDTYYNVAMAKTSYLGTDLVYTEWYNSFYKFIVVVNGETVGTFGPLKISTSPQVFRLGQEPISNYTKFQDIQYTLTYVNNTQNFVLTYVKPDGRVTSGCLRVTKRNTTNDYNICDVCETSNSATLYCNVAAAGNGTFIADFYATGSFAWIDTIIETIGAQNALYEMIGNDNATGLAIIMAGVVLSFFLISPAVAVFGMILGMLATFALGFQPFDTGAFLGIVLLGGAIIWAVKR